MDAYIICSVRSGIRQALSEVFPGCKVVDRKPVRGGLHGNAKKALDYIVGWFEFAEVGARLKFSDAVKATGIDRQSFKNHVRRNEAFQEALAAEGIVEQGDAKSMTCCRRADDIR